MGIPGRLSNRDRQQSIRGVQLPHDWEQTGCCSGDLDSLQSSVYKIVGSIRHHLPTTKAGLLGHQFATISLGPLLLLQGRRARRRIPRLPEPPGDREGQAGSGPPLRLLITGDSAAAGVGASSQQEALLGRVVSQLSRNYTVRWTLEAVTGATTRTTLTRLRTLAESPFDVVLTSLGVNDVTAGVRRNVWRQQQKELRELLRDRFGSPMIVVSGLPPVDFFPALPQPLRWYLGRRARQFDRDLQGDMEHESAASYLGFDLPRDLRLMASDGFHPGPGAYQAWGAMAARMIMSKLDSFRQPQ